MLKMVVNVFNDIWFYRLSVKFDLLECYIEEFNERSLFIVFEWSRLGVEFLLWVRKNVLYLEIWNSDILFSGCILIIDYDG